MLSILDYTITETLYSSHKTVVYRGYRDEDRCPFVFKTLADHYPDPKDLARLQHEYNLTQSWPAIQNSKQTESHSHASFLLHSIALIKRQNTLVLVQHDIGGVALNRLLAAQPLPLDIFFTLAIGLAHNLNRIHQCHLIHKDINPSNIAVNIHKKQVQIIDFGLATRLSRETTQFQNPGHLEGSLAYISPEQTGRMNRSIDYRSDFYSLGATFYEMLTGMPPFNESEPMALVHCHLAKTPPALHEHRPNIPRILNALVQKLMAKTAETRYQSAFGLIADLETCRNLLLNNQNKTELLDLANLADFTLGKQDISEHFSIPQKLYGRENEVQQVLDAFARVAAGNTEMLLIAGYSGIGKTALVHEIYKPITEKNGYCIDGKFDQFQRNIPYASLIQAFQELVRQLLTESPARIARWKSLLEQALGPIAQVIIDVIPEVEWIMGPQAPVPELPSSQGQNRLNLAFQQFIRTFTSKEHPLVLFLDDLQWADLPSLQLIKHFMSDAGSGYLLFIGAYRDNEVTPAHPLMLTLEDIHKTTTRIQTITLSPLSGANVQQLVAETFHLEQTQTTPLTTQLAAQLADLCIRKTRGNPFFLSQFLRTLVETGQITFNHTLGQWEWEIEKLQQTPISDNVVELMSNHIQTLPQDTQTLLQLAACVGNHFDLNTLVWAQEQSAKACADALWPALQKELILPLDDTYKYMPPNNGSGPKKLDEPPQEGDLKVINFKFIHDRVQQAAYSLIANDTKAIFHLRIGRKMVANMRPTEREERIFDVAYQLNQGQNLITSSAEKEALAQINLLAGKKASAASAHLAALPYFQAGITLIGEQAGWEQHYELTLALFEGASVALSMNGDFKQMARLTGIMLQKANNLLDKVKAYKIQIEASILENKAIKAIRIALTILAQLGIKLPEKTSQLHTLFSLLETKWTLYGKSFEDLKRAPPMNDPVRLATMDIIGSLGSAAYFGAPKLFSLIIFKQVNLTARYGISAHAAHAYASYGLILCGALNDIEKGHAFGKLALTILEKSPPNALKVKVSIVVDGLLKHWKGPLHNQPVPILQSYHDGLQSGNYEYAAYAATLYCQVLFFIGKPFNELKAEIIKYEQVLVQFKHMQKWNLNNVLSQMVCNLTGENDNPLILKGPNFNEDTIDGEIIRTTLFMFHFFKLILCYMFGEYTLARTHMLKAEKYLGIMISHPAVPICYFYMALVRLALMPQVQKRERTFFLKEVSSIQKKMKNWAHHAPMNYLHKWHLIEAERERVTGHDLEAMKHYENAILLAKEHHFLHEAALANELAARFHLAKGRERLGKGHLQDAHYGYQQWGAYAKTKHLTQQFPQYLLKPDAANKPQALTSNGTSSGTLDLSTVMKISQSISGEIILERLLEKLIRIALENAGAEKGILLLKKNGLWHIEAEGNVNDTQVTVLHALPLDPDLPDTLLPLAVVQFVEFSKEALVLDHACRQGRFMNEPWILKNHTKSVLCLPVLLHGKLAGMLYLENNLTESAFTADRLAVLKILTSQAAISIENARVYEHLEATVAQRTVALSNSNAALSDSNAALSESHAALSQSHTDLSEAYAIAEIARQQAETARQQAENAEYQATEALNNLRAAQNQLVQSAKMASLGHLVAGVAHELNTPIGNALTTASVLVDVSLEMKETIKQATLRRATMIDFMDNTVVMSDVISRSCQRAATLINSFKQVAVDQTSEKRRKFDLHSLVEDNIAALRAGFTHAPWKINAVIPPNIPCDSYPGPLGQVIANLVQNAAVHAFAGRTEQNSGTLNITASITTSAQGERVEMQFSDDGLGMEADVLAHIFEPFYTTQMGWGGPGLGLSIALNIVTAVLGGTLMADSVRGSGSRFYLCFPLTAPSQNALSKPA